MSLASLAIGSKEVDAMSTAASTAVLIISVISTKTIESSSTMSSIFETSTASAAISTATAMRKWIRMFRWVRSTWMMPSKATLKLSRIEGGRRPGAGLILPPHVACQGEQRRSRGLLQRSCWILRCSNPREDRALAPLHLVSVLEPEQVEDAVDERPAPLVGDDLGADDDVAEGPRHAVRQIVQTVDREGEDICR